MAPERAVILREFPPGDDAAMAEVRILGALDGLDGLAPRLLACDLASVAAEGSWTGFQGVLDRPGGSPAANRGPTARQRRVPGRRAHRSGVFGERIADHFLAAYQAASG
jgi:hypothetical protein